MCARAPGKGLLEGKVPGVLLNLLRAGVDFCPVVEEPLQLRRLRPHRGLRPRRPAHHRLPGVVVQRGARVEGHGDLESVGAAAGKKRPSQLFMLSMQALFPKVPRRECAQYSVLPFDCIVSRN